MRKILISLPLLLCAGPAFAQEAPPQLPPELTDPASFQRLAGQLQVVSHALMNVRVGEVQAALEGREATRQERNITLRDMARRKDPDFDRHLQQQVASLGPQLQRGMQAVNRALPEMQRAVEEAQKSLDRAMANMPDPTYPKR